MFSIMLGGSGGQETVGCVVGGKVGRVVTGGVVVGVVVGGRVGCVVAGGSVGCVVAGGSVGSVVSGGSVGCVVAGGSVGCTGLVDETLGTVGKGSVGPGVVAPVEISGLVWGGGVGAVVPVVGASVVTREDQVVAPGVEVVGRNRVVLLVKLLKRLARSPYSLRFSPERTA